MKAHWWANERFERSADMPGDESDTLAFRGNTTRRLNPSRAAWHFDKPIDEMRREPSQALNRQLLMG